MKNVIEKQLEDFVAEAKNGNKEAFGKLFELTNQRAYYTALKITENTRDAEDMVQEAYIQAFSSLNTLNENGKFEKWLNRIVANKCRDLVKKNKPNLFSEYEGEESDANFEESLEGFDLSMIPEQVIDHKALKNIVMQCIDNLPVEQRMCVVMYYYNELSVSEISESLSVPVGTVKSRLSIARKTLGKKFEDIEKKDNIKFYSGSLPIMVALAFRMGGQNCKIPALSLMKITKNIPNVFFNNGFSAFLKTIGISGLIKRIICGVGAAAIITGGSMVARDIVVEKSAELATTTSVVSQISDNYAKKNSANKKYAKLNSKKDNKPITLSALAISDSDNNTYYIDENGVFVVNKRGRVEQISTHKPLNIYFGSCLMYIYGGSLYQYKNEKLSEIMQVEGEYLFGESSSLFSISKNRNSAYIIDINNKTYRSVEDGGSEYKFLEKKLYYRSADNEIKRVSFSNGSQNVEKVVSLNNEDDLKIPYTVKSGKIYYTSFDSDESGVIFIKDIASGEVETITLNGGIRDYAVSKGKIYYSLISGGLYVFSIDSGAVKLANGDYYCSATSGGHMMWCSTNDTSAFLIKSGSSSLINIPDGCEIIEFSIVENTLYYRGDNGYDAIRL